MSVVTVLTVVIVMSVVPVVSVVTVCWQVAIPGQSNYSLQSPYFLLQVPPASTLSLIWAILRPIVKLWPKKIGHLQGGLGLSI